MAICYLTLLVLGLAGEVISYLTLHCLALLIVGKSYLILPRLALRRLALPRLALPRLAFPYFALPCLALPCLALPYLALPSLALLYLLLPGTCVTPNIRMMRLRNP